jgi:hypothetical protein
MSISEPFRYRNDSFQSDILSSDIGITDVDVGCRISPTLRSMSMPTYANRPLEEYLSIYRYVLECHQLHFLQRRDIFRLRVVLYNVEL